MDLGRFQHCCNPAVSPARTGSRKPSEKGVWSSLRRGGKREGLARELAERGKSGEAVNECVTPCATTRQLPMWLPFQAGTCAHTMYVDCCWDESPLRTQEMSHGWLRSSQSSLLLAQVVLDRGDKTWMKPISIFSLWLLVLLYTAKISQGHFFLDKLACWLHTLSCKSSHS